MPINPFINLFGQGSSGSSILGTGAGAAAAAGGGFPWLMVIPLALSFLQSSGLFGKTESQRRDEMSQELMNLVKPEYQYWGSQARGLNPIVLQALLNQFKRTANWGWPEGKGMDLSFLENFLKTPNLGMPQAPQKPLSRITPSMLRR